ncbi:MAG: glycosyltransferase [Phycisphaerales bacterium]|nr:glycosyltransferase [Phycisphaerales bacterium]
MPVPNSSAGVRLTIAAPAHNERDNVRRLVEEIVDAVAPMGVTYEIVIVDDGSTDDTLDVLRDVRSTCPELRILRMTNTPPGRGNGQSAAFSAAFGAARGDYIAVLDADLQNDPADLPAMYARMMEVDADMVQGDRSAARRDTFVRRMSSVVGRLFRRWLLGDTIRDTGCSLRLMRAEVARAIPLEFRGMHRFIPVTARQLGYTVVEVPVHHRPRTAGEAKYGVWNRAIPGLVDCLAVRWMRNRRRPTTCESVDAAGAATPRPEPIAHEIMP